MQKLKFTYAITLTLVNCTSSAMLTWAKPVAIAKHIPDSSEFLQSFEPPPLPDNGAPTGRSRGAAGRGNKCIVEPPLTALVPASEQSLGKEQQVTYVWGKTVAEYPTFWFYVPYSRVSLHSVEFVLQDAKDNDIYRTSIKLTDIPGIVGLHLPSTLPPLKIGKLYHWFFKTRADCDPQQPSDIEDYVEGWVQRVQLSPVLAKQLETAPPPQQLNIYTANGIWYEALTTLAKLRLAAPQDVKLNVSWAKLLQSAGLGDIASKPIVPSREQLAQQQY